MVPFEFLKIELSDKSTVSAHRPEGVNEFPIIFEVSRKAGAAKWAFWPTSERPGTFSREQVEFLSRMEEQGKDVPASILPPKRVRRYLDYYTPENERKFLALIESLGLSVFYLSSDRQFISDKVEPIADEHLRRFFSSEARQSRDFIALARSQFLARALDDTHRWIERRGFEAATKGSGSADVIYSDVVERIANLRAPKTASSVSESKRLTTIDSLRLLEERSQAYSRFGFTRPLETRRMISAIESARGANAQIIHSVIEPYLESFQARLDALQPTYDLTTRFIELINHFFSFKSLNFTVRSGFSIVDALNKTLAPSQLSSGEQQLLLLFCHTLHSRHQSRVFMVDEPEISLNITWQRELVDSLRDISSEGGVQFFFATHSLEIITGHRDKLVELERPSTD